MQPRFIAGAAGIYFGILVTETSSRLRSRMRASTSGQYSGGMYCITSYITGLSAPLASSSGVAYFSRMFEIWM